MTVRAQTTVLLVFAACLIAGCRPASYRKDADNAGYDIVRRAQGKALGQEEPFTIERPADALRRQLLLDQGLPHVGPESLGSGDLKPVPHWPEESYPLEAPLPPEAGRLPAREPLLLNLIDSLQVAARNNREYQTSKENVFRAALALDLEANEFRSLLFAGAETELSGDYRTDDTVAGVESTADVSLERRLKNGALCQHFNR